MVALKRRSVDSQLTIDWNSPGRAFEERLRREAEEILATTEILDGLIEANPKEILSEMIAFWNTGKIPKIKTSGRQAANNKSGKINEQLPNASA